MALLAPSGLESPAFVPRRLACHPGPALPQNAGNLRLALFAIIVMIAYGSLYPFAFHSVEDGPGPLLGLIQGWDKTPGRGDFVSNILLYMPLGFIGAITVGQARRALSARSDGADRYGSQPHGRGPAIL